LCLSGESAVSSDPAGHGNESVDYALLLPDGRPIAIVEAKKSSRDALAGERHAADCADRTKSIHGFDPFTFLANGNDVFFWGRPRYPTRPASGFFTREDLERLAFLDRFHEPLLGASVEPGSSTGITRSWQLRARAMVRQVYWCPIKTVSERIETAQRRFLLVLATGTGKPAAPSPLSSYFAVRRFNVSCF
jgi:type I restriction enzyme R subunit